MLPEELTTTGAPSPQPVTTASFGQVTVVLPPPTTAEPTNLPTTAPPTVEPTTAAPTAEPTSEFCSVSDSDIQAIRTAIEDFIDEEDNINYPAKFVRLGFHDCVGGCDGCVSETTSVIVEGCFYCTART